MDPGYNYTNLLESIRKKRQQLISLGTNKGLGSKETIKCSKELDELLFKYQYQQYCKLQTYIQE